MLARSSQPRCVRRMTTLSTTETKTAVSALDGATLTAVTPKKKTRSRPVFAETLMLYLLNPDGPISYDVTRVMTRNADRVNFDGDLYDPQHLLADGIDVCVRLFLLRDCARARQTSEVRQPRQILFC